MVRLGWGRRSYAVEMYDRLHGKSKGLQYSAELYTVDDLPKLKKMNLDFFVKNKAVGGLKSIDELDWSDPWCVVARGQPQPPSNTYMLNSTYMRSYLYNGLGSGLLLPEPSGRPFRDAIARRGESIALGLHGTDCDTLLLSFAEGERKDWARRRVPRILVVSIQLRAYAALLPVVLTTASSCRCTLQSASVWLLHPIWVGCTQPGRAVVL